MGLQETLLGTPGQTQVHQTGATRPPGYHMAQDVYRTLEQLMNSGTPFPTYQGNLDPGLSPMLQNSLRMAQGYSESSPSEALSGINGVLGRFMNPSYSNPGGGSSMPFSGQFRQNNAPTYNGGRVGGYDPQMSNQTDGGLMGGGGGPGLGTDPSKPGYNPGLDYMPTGGNSGMPRPRPGGGMPGGNMGGGAPSYGPPKQPIQGQQNFGGGGWAPPGGQQGGTPPWAPPSQGGPPIGPSSPWGNKVGMGGNVQASWDTFNPQNPMPPISYGGRPYGSDARPQQIPQRGPGIDYMIPGGGGGASWRPGQQPQGGPGVDPMMPSSRPSQPWPSMPYPPPNGQGQPPMLSFPGGQGGPQVDPMMGAQPAQLPQGGAQPGFDFNSYLRSFLGQGGGGGQPMTGANGQPYQIPSGLPQMDTSVLTPYFSGGGR